MNIYTINEWMTTLGKALSEGDGNTIMALQDVTHGWMQSQQEDDAQNALLDGALDSIGW